MKAVPNAKGEALPPAHPAIAPMLKSTPAAPRPAVAEPAVPAQPPAAQPPAAQPPAAQPPAAQPPAAQPPAAQPPAAQPPAEPPSPEPAAPSAEPGGETVSCPQCNHVNSTAFKFCASCGFNLSKVASAAAEPAAQPAPAAPPTVGWKLTVLRADGSDAGTYNVPAESTIVGRDTGEIFGGDSYLSPQHAKLTVRDGKLFVLDAGSLNGTYIKLKRDEPELIADGQYFRIGQEIIRFEKLHPEAPQDGVEKMGSPSMGYFGRIVLVTGRDTDGNAYPIPQTGVHIGRERGHVLFPEDGYVSGLHCVLAVENDELMLTDLGSSNGTFVRLSTEYEVGQGDILLMGQQLFRATM